MTVSLDVWRVLGDPLAGPVKEGPLSGELVAVKDLYAVAGQVIGAGVPEFAREQAPQAADAHAVAALRAAGAAIRGIAQTDQFAYSLAGQNAAYGTPPNPAAPGRIPGGSTSGPSVAVSSGQVTIGLGTDTAGSIRIPSSYQGLWGLRSTHDLIPKEGLLELAPSFDTVGWVTRDPGLLRRTAAALIPPNGQELLLADSVLTSATLTGLAEPVIAERVSGTASRLAAALGLPHREWELPPSVLDGWFIAFRTVQAYEAWQVHGEWITAHPGVLGNDVADRFAAAAAVTADQCAAARIAVGEARETIRAVLRDSLMVMPAASSPPPAVDAPAVEIDAIRAATLHLTCVAGLAGAPVVSAPVAAGLGGAEPGNVALVASPGTDVQLCGLAERLLGGTS